MDIRTLSTKGELRQAEALLEREGVGLDAHLEKTLGLFDGDTLAATGSYFRNTLRCLAVDGGYQGEGLMAQVVSALVTELFSLGRRHLFVYTKAQAAPLIQSLGFYPIARTHGAVFLENRRTGFRDYLASLGEKRPGVSGAVVMNANPFTLGHLYLAETAAAAVDTLHLFIVSEDLSAFPFRVRDRLVREGTAHLGNVVCHPTDSYLVSAAVFPSYFIRAAEDVTRTQAQLDAAVFARIAQALSVTRRFVGEEPFSPATSLYNAAMAAELPGRGVGLTVLKRREEGGAAVSASRVRALIQQGDLAAVRALVPDSTYRFLTGGEAAPIIRALQAGPQRAHP